MQILKPCILIILIVLLVFPVFLLAEKNFEALKTEIQERNEALIEARTAHNLKKLLDFYFEDAVLMPDFKPVKKGKNAIEAMFREDFKQVYKSSSAQFHITDLQVAGDKIIEHSTWTLSLSGGQLPSPQAYFGSSVSIWKRDKDGKLKMTFNIWNLDHNPFSAQ